jgi:putative peptide zinc metalloprotease protein
VTQPIQSSLWYRVADLRPKLRSHARLHRHRYRGELWYLLEDPASGRVNRFTPAARLVIALMDGRRRVSDLWEIANRQQGENAPTQDEMIQLLGQLHAADLLQTDVTPDVAELFSRSAREEKSRARRSYGNPMAIRLPLWDPDRVLNRFLPLIRLIWSRAGALVWLAVVLPTLFLIPPHWPELSNNFSDRVLAVDNLFILYLVFPILKAFHELGHATATKAGGGEVHDLGLIFLVMMPIPYVEASASSTFKSKYQRALVGAAGVAVELFIAALAFYLWLLIEPGTARAVLFNVMIIAGVSTVIFNGNPLLRYDAYYILADLTEIPNLGARSQRYWIYLLQRYLLGADETPPDLSPSERVWLAAYGLASSIYRVIVTVVIALFIAGRFFFVGVLLAIWAIIAMTVMPVARGVMHVTTSPRLRGNRWRAITVAFGGVFMIGTVLAAAPVPDHTSAQGIVWLSEQALVRAGASGFMKEFAVQPGERTEIADALVVLNDPTIDASVRESQARVAEMEASLAFDSGSDRAKADIARQRLDEERSVLASLQLRAADLVVRARMAGVFVVTQMGDMPGRYYRKGDLLGYVIGSSPAIVRVVVPQDEVDRVRDGVDRVRVRLGDRAGTVIDGKVVRRVPGGEQYLPSRALAVEGGGDIPTDPRDAKGPKALERMFHFDIELAEPAKFAQFGQRVMVRFEHPGAPLLTQWYRGVRLLFLSRFGV